MHAVPPALPWFRPGPQLEPPELLGSEGWTGVGVVLLPTKQVPAEHDELSGDGDRGDVRSSASPDALREGPERTGGSRRRPGRLHEHMACSGGPLLGDRAMPGRRGTRLPHP